MGDQTDDLLSTRMSPLVVELCERLLRDLPPERATPIRDILERLRGPLQLAVAGRIKSGKSTVVNALIGRRVSPTDVRECTRMVTRFQYGTVDRVEVRKLDGSVITLPFDADGLVPRDLGCAPAEVAVVDAYLTYDVLRAVTVIDTPGLASLDAESAQRSQGMLGDTATTGTGTPDERAAVDQQSQIAVSSAEAVLYVITQSIRADDADALSAFRRHSGPQTSSPVNALAVLNKADQVVADDPLVAAADLAREHAHTLRHTVSDVLPLVGLVAESALTGEFTEADVAALRAIAALDDTSRQMLFLSTDFFLRPEIDVPLEARERLLERLDRYGVERAVGAIRDQPTITTGEVRRLLEELSGFQQVRTIIDGVFSVRADGIKSSVALSALDQYAATCPPGVRDRIFDALEGIYQRPEAHQLRVLEAASLITSGKVELPDDMFDEVRRLVTGTGPAEMLGRPQAGPDELVAAALDAAGRWRSFATFGSTPAQSRVAHAIHRAFFLMWQQLRNPMYGGAPNPRGAM